MPQYVTTFGSMTFERRLFPSRGGRFKQTQSAACFRLCPHSDDSPPARMKEKYHISNIFKCLSNFPTRHWVGISMQDISNNYTLPPTTVQSQVQLSILYMAAPTVGSGNYSVLLPHKAVDFAPRALECAVEPSQHPLNLPSH